MNRREDRKLKKDLGPKFLNTAHKYSQYLFIFILVLLITSLIRGILKNLKVSDRVKEERRRVEELKAEKDKLENRVTEAESQVNIERQLRDKLGLAKEGEYILVLPEDDILRKLAPKEVGTEETLPDPNWVKWMKLFDIKI